MDIATHYSEHLKTLASAKMAFVMGLVAFSLIYAPNPQAFLILENSGLKIAPIVLGILCAMCALGYLFLGYPEMRRRPIRAQRFLFWLLSAPLAAYVFIIGIALVINGHFLYGVLYSSIYIIIFLTGFALYNGYTLLLEYMVLAAMITLFLSTSYAFVNQEIVLLQMFNIRPVVMSALAFICAIGYSTFLHPRIRRLPYWTKQRLFVAWAGIIPVYAIMTVLGILNAGSGSWIAPLNLINLHLIIFLLGRSLYRPVQGVDSSAG